MELSRLKSLVSDGKIFGVRFVKRTDGTVRRMACRTGVVPPPSPHAGERHWNPDDHGLLQVWDCHKRGSRMIPADSILEVSVRGQRLPG